jgi:hypothetical protein
VLGAVEAAAGKRARRRGACFCLAAARERKHGGRCRSRIGRSVDGRADLCVYDAMAMVLGA